MWTSAVPNVPRLSAIAPLDSFQEAAEAAGIHVLQLMEDAGVMALVAWEGVCLGARRAWRPDRGVQADACLCATDTLGG